MANRSYETDGTEDPSRQWLQKTVRVKGHPEWGLARVLRWYPAAAGLAPRLRILPHNITAPQVVALTDIEEVKATA